MYELLSLGASQLYDRLVLFPLAFMKIFAFFQFFPIPAMGSGFRGNIYLIGAGLSLMTAVLASDELLGHAKMWSTNQILSYSLFSYLYGLLLCAPFVICLRSVTVIADFIEGFVNNIAAPARSELLQDEVTSFGHLIGMFLILKIIDEPFFNAITVLVFWQDVEVLMLFSDWNMDHAKTTLENIDLNLIYDLFVKLLPLFGVVTVLELLGLLVARFLPEFNMFVFLFPIKYMVGLFLLAQIANLVVKDVIQWIRIYGMSLGV